MLRRVYQRRAPQQQTYERPVPSTSGKREGPARTDAVVATNAAVDGAVLTSATSATSASASSTAIVARNCAPLPPTTLLPPAVPVHWGTRIEQA